MDLGDRVLRSALRAEAIGTRLEVRLEDRLEHQLQRGLHDPVARGRDPEPTELARRLRDQPSPAPAAGRTPRPSDRLADRRATPPLPAGLDARGRVRRPRQPMRAPLLPRTRSTRRRGTPGHRRGCADHRTGDQGRSPAHRCSFVCIPSTRAAASSSVGPRRAGIHQRPPGLAARRCDPAGPLRHVTGFPGLGLLRRPPPHPDAHQPTTRLPTGATSHGEGDAGWFPRSLSIRSTGSAPSYAPAASPRLRRRTFTVASRRRHQPAQESPADQTAGGAPLLPSPDPPGSSWWLS